MEPPIVVFRDRTSMGVEVVTYVPWEDNEKMRALARQMIWAGLSGDPEADRAIKSVTQLAFTEDADRRGYSMIMAYHLAEALKEAQAMRAQMAAKGQAPAPYQPPASPPSPYPSQQQPQVGGPPPDAGGTWGVQAPPVGGGAPMPPPMPMPPQGAPQQVQGVRTYSRTVSGPAAAPSAPRASGGGGGRGVTAGAQNVKRQAGGFKTYSRAAPTRAPDTSAPAAGDPWAAQRAQTIAALARRGQSPPSDSGIIVTTSEPGGEE